MRARVVTWNVHGWVGRDGVRLPGRSFGVLAELDADVVALQEVEGTDWHALAEAQGYAVVQGPTLGCGFGNAVLTRSEVAGVERVDLSVVEREPRGALDVRLAHADGPLRLIATHFGLRRWERREQARRLARHLADASPLEPLVLAGDLNDWTPRGRQLRALAEAIGPLSQTPTFPSHRPLLALDRIAWSAPNARAVTERVDDARARLASDHLPLHLELEVGKPED